VCIRTAVHQKNDLQKISGRPRQNGGSRPHSRGARSAPIAADQRRFSRLRLRDPERLGPRSIVKRVAPSLQRCGPGTARRRAPKHGCRAVSEKGADRASARGRPPPTPPRRSLRRSAVPGGGTCTGPDKQRVENWADIGPLFGTRNGPSGGSPGPSSHQDAAAVHPAGRYQAARETFAQGLVDTQGYDGTGEAHH
jgi:hypothetical protein